MIDCFTLLEKGPSQGQSLVIPNKYGNLAISHLIKDELLTMPHVDVSFSLVHVSL